jgi:hypothetical protein
MTFFRIVCAGVVLLTGSAAAQDGGKAIQKTTSGTDAVLRTAMPAVTMLMPRRRRAYFFTNGQAGSGGPNASSPEILARIL